MQMIIMLKILILFYRNQNRNIKFRIHIMKGQINKSYIKFNEISNKSFEIMYHRKSLYGIKN